MTNSLTVEMWPISKVLPYEKNAKLHPDDQIEKLAKAIETFGWTQPIVVDADGVIIAGHGRRLAALKLGRDKVPVVVRRDLSKAEADGLRLSDNRVASQLYDTDLLQKELSRLNEEIDISNLGFDLKEIQFLTADLGAFDDSLFIDNVTEAVEQQRLENTSKEAEMDASAAPVADALGFKRVTIQQSRTIRTFISQIETQTGLKGADAFVAYIQTVQS